MPLRPPPMTGTRGAARTGRFTTVIVVELPTMAFVVRRPGGRFELRESIATPAGPRAHTLASFTRLDAATIRYAAARATTPWHDDAVVRSARRAGALVDLEPANRHARELLSALADRSPLDPTLRSQLVDALTSRRAIDDEAMRSLTMTADERGQVLRALCALGDALPRSARSHEPLRFPPLQHAIAR